MIDRAAMMRKAIPASHRLLVRNHTMKATMAAGMSQKTSLMRKMSTMMPMMTNAAKIKSSTML